MPMWIIINEWLSELYEHGPHNKLCKNLTSIHKIYGFGWNKDTWVQCSQLYKQVIQAPNHSWCQGELGQGYRKDTCNHGTKCYSWLMLCLWLMLTSSLVKWAIVYNYIEKGKPYSCVSKKSTLLCPWIDKSFVSTILTSHFFPQSPIYWMTLFSICDKTRPCKFYMRKASFVSYVAR